VAGTWGAISGTLRYFADPYGNARAAIEGTNVPLALIKKYATSSGAKLVYDPRHKSTPLAMERRVEYFGFELEREREAVHDFPPGLENEARRVLAEALARGEARHAAVHRNRQEVEAVREAYRRSGGKTARMNQADLTAWYAGQLASARNLQEYRAAPMRFSADDFVSRAIRHELMALPGAAEIRERTVPMHYEVEETPDGPLGVARLVMPEKVARGLIAEELPEIDRPLRFTVTRGARGNVKAASIDELHDALERPYTDSEVERGEGGSRGDRADRGDRGDRARGPWSRDGGNDRGPPRGERSAGGPGGKFGGDRKGGKGGSHKPGSPAGRGKRPGKRG